MVRAALLKRCRDRAAASSFCKIHRKSDFDIGNRMDVSQLNFHHLYYFWQVAKLGHMTQAAQRVHTSQSALSAQIRMLEERLGEPLFVRERRKLALTDSGRLVLSYAEEIFGLGQELLGRLQGQAHGMSRLRVGSVATLSRNYQENLLRPLIGDPTLVLTLESGTLEGLLARLVQHQLDLVLSNESVPADPQRPLSCRLLGSQAVSVVGPAKRWRNARLKVPAGLDGLELALPGPRNALRGQFDALCASAGVAPRLRAEVDDMAMLRLIARDSGWLTLLPEVVVQDELRAGTLAVVGTSKALRENFYAISVPRRHHGGALDRLLAGA